MSWLLDVNILLASRWDTHAKHEEVSTWLDTLLEFHTTPIVELGFMRISLSPAYAATWEDAHRSLTSLLSRHTHRFPRMTSAPPIPPNPITRTPPTPTSFALPNDMDSNSRPSTWRS